MRGTEKAKRRYGKEAMLVGWVVFAAWFMFAWALVDLDRIARERRKLRLRAGMLLYGSDGFESLRKKERPSRLQRLMRLLLRTAPRFSAWGSRIDFASSDADVQRLLLYAGQPLGMTVEQFQGLKILLALLGFLSGLMLMIIGFPFGPLWPVLLPLAGYGGSIYWLRRSADARQDEITRSLSDFLDIMSVTLKAGLPLDRALALVAQGIGGPLREEWEFFLQRLALGHPREQVWGALIARNRSAEFQALIKALIQGHRLGTPVSETFAFHAEQMRRIRREKAKEAAAKAAPKISFVTTLLIVPATMFLFVVLFGLNIARTLGPIFSSQTTAGTP
ncbi:type II secretion system F family protein [Hydrogenibacillus schlegelii]|uniref:Type II secretion system protein GspF domain-containing protein n=1 Tax=Hydrogenibacillus schlegelii TaxID=1484 RepID=A0A179IQF2_HYDSH|nr:type II secretion system F family protein [Hydrogenibacillus schlegelii]OAR04082.1 hypothetical protein SA87_01050 [Hydrogenibacillus schlegelii]